jgi:hypothetical protein
MEHRITHDLEPELARKAIRKAVEAYTARFAKYHPEANWTGDDVVKVGFTAKGMKLAGDLRLEPRALVIDFHVPFLLRPFKSKAVDVIEQEVKVWFQKAREGQV